MRSGSMADEVACVLEIDFADEGTARAVHDALAPDNASFARSHLEGSRLVAEMAAPSPMSLLHTVEDFLACLAVAQRTVDAAKAL